MAARLFSYTAFDTDGDPVSGAPLDVWVRNSSTRTPWYTNSGLSVPAANPIIANGAGRLLAYFDDTDEFSIQVTNPDTAEIILQGDIIGGVLIVSGGEELTVEASWLPVISAPFDGVRKVNTLADLQALDTEDIPNQQAIEMLGRNSAGDRGGGLFRRVTGDQSALVIAATKTVASVNTGTDVITATAHGFVTGQAFIASATDAGLTINTVYYAAKTGTDTLTAHTTINNAIAGTSKVNITALAGSLSLKKLYDPAQAIFVIATGDDLDGSDGVWVRNFTGPTWSEWWGHTRDGSGDNAPALNQFLAYIAMVRAEGRTGDGEFDCDSTLYWDLTGVESGERCPSWLGAGAAVTKITTSHQSAGLQIPGDILDKLLIGDFLLRGPGTGGTADGIVFDAIPFAALQRLDVFNYRYGLDGTDTVSILLQSCNIRGNLRAWRMRTSGSGDESAPNAIMSLGCDFGDNTEYGLLFNEPGLVFIQGGAVQGVGTSTTTGWGIKVTEVGGAAVGLLVDGILFEGNKGLADIIIAQTAAAPAKVLHVVTGCSFTRHEPVANQFVTNNILVTQTGGPEIRVKVDGGFQARGAYSESAARRNIVAPPGVVQDAGCMFSSATARPNGNIFRKWSFIVAADGTAVSLPKDWTSVKNATGSYSVTHSLGLGATAYSVTGLANMNSVAMLERIFKGSNSFDFLTTDAGVATDAQVMFEMAVLDN